jgi:hypothetical protein
VIYSVHDQIRGDFVYYDYPDGIAINDDQPVPRFERELIGPLGIAASDAGRPLPPGANAIGRGALPRGKVSTGKLGTEKRGGFLGPSPDGIGGLGDTSSLCLGGFCWSTGGMDNSWIVGVLTAVVGFGLTSAFLYRHGKNSAFGRRK